MNDFNKDSRKDWRRRLNIRRNEHGAYVVGPSQRHAKFIDWIGSVLHGDGYRFTRNASALPGTPHFHLKKHNAVVFACDCTSSDYGIEHDCQSLQYKSAGTLAAVEEDTKLLDLVVSAVEKLGPRVDVVFKCQTVDRVELRKRLSSFIKGENTYSQRDRIAWLRRRGAPVEFGIIDDEPKHFLIPAIVLDRQRVDFRKLFIGRLGGNHADVLSLITPTMVNNCENLDFGFVDHSGSFLSRDGGLAYERRFFSR